MGEQKGKFCPESQGWGTDPKETFTPEEMWELPVSLTGGEGQIGSAPGRHRCRGMKWPGQRGN